MDYSVIFNNLISDISINPQVSLKQARFIYSQSGGTVNPANKVVYPEIRGIEVFCHLDKEPDEGRKLLEPLETALYIAEEIFTALVAKTQRSCYLAKPITCIYNNKTYVLEESFWREYMPADSIFQGGEAYLDDANFIDEEKNFHPMYHFYRAAKDETNSNDYRALNAWRFLEALYGKSDKKLMEHLITVEKQPEKVVTNFYENIRCAIAHAKLLRNNPNTDKVMLPKSLETQFDGGLMIDLLEMLKYLDSVVKKLSPTTTTIVR